MNKPSLHAINEAKRLIRESPANCVTFAIALSRKTNRLKAYAPTDRAFHKIMDEHDLLWRMVGTYRRPSLHDIAVDIDCFINDELTSRLNP